MCGPDPPHVEITGRQKRLIQFTWQHAKLEHDIFPAKLFTFILSKSEQIHRTFALYTRRSNDAVLSEEHNRQAGAFFEFFDRLIIEKDLNKYECADTSYDIGTRHVHYRFYGLHSAHFRVVAEYMSDFFTRTTLQKYPRPEIKDTWSQFLQQIADYMAMGLGDAVKRHTRDGGVASDERTLVESIQGSAPRLGPASVPVDDKRSASQATSEQAPSIKTVSVISGSVHSSRNG